MKLRILFITSILTLLAGCYNTKPSDNPDHQLLDAAAKGEAGTIISLLQQGANPEVFESRRGKTGYKRGWTPLIVASGKGHHDVVMTLLKNGAVVDAVAKSKKENALIIASSFGFNEIVKTLIEAKANIEFRDYLDSTPIFMPAFEGHIDVLKTLIDAGADVNAQSSINDATALYLATIKSRTKTIEALLAAGAKTTIYMKGEEVSIVDEAKTRNRKDVLAIFKKYGYL
jgi:uncharacterized protein